jgi:hypothetical protein
VATLGIAVGDVKKSRNPSANKVSLADRSDRSRCIPVELFGKVEGKKV